MDWVSIAFILFLLMIVIWYIVSINRNSKSQKIAIESNEKLTESNNRLAEAVNHLADIIAKK